MAWDESCRAPNPGEVPTLRAGEAPQACDRTNYGNVPPNPDLDPLALMRSVSPSVVRVDQLSTLPSFLRWMLGDSQSWPNGSGFMVGRDGNDCLIATNNHVASSLSSIAVRTNDNGIHPATVAAADPANDLAILRVPSGDGLVCRPAPISGQQPNAGDRVAAVGHPNGSRYQFISPATVRTIGLPSDNGVPLGPPDNRTSVIVNGHTEHGNSGSALFNDRGEVVGIVFAGNHLTITTAIPTDPLRRLLATIPRRAQ
jgi:S1-C subfamily serine protease